ncbi:MAG TPA: hypothetical protein GXX36_02635 [Clostridiaceae bacterium]|nr:hypothetical protein [Clostridiaceae bacterium]
MGTIPVMGTIPRNVLRAIIKENDFKIRVGFIHTLKYQKIEMTNMSLK